MKQRKKRSFKERQEQFTFAGFIMVSTWALAFFIPSLTIPAALETFSAIQEFRWEYYLVLYMACWIYCFWTMCLMPKMRGEK